MSPWQIAPMSSPWPLSQSLRCSRDLRREGFEGAPVGAVAGADGGNLPPCVSKPCVLGRVAFENMEPR